jgi:4-diphosphocytidyl-2-C-methyl-D-erythritol kinase
MKTITLLSPAKINLTLEILGKRKDGYHLLRSIMQPIDLFDEITLHAEQGEGIELETQGLKLPDNNENLIYKSAELYLKKTGISARLKFKLKKRIPLQAGLGGGSSNAAAALTCLNRIYKALNTDELLKLAIRLGADVPFFINCRSSLVEGLGEKITVLNSFPLLNYLVVKPSFGLSTKDVYDRWDDMNTNSGTRININESIEKYKNGEFLLKNDLEEAAISLNSKISELKNLLRQLGCQNVSMTGSGTTIFALFSSGFEATDVYEYLKDSMEYEVFLSKGISGWHRLS